jgi:hypothetical protein
MCKTQRRLAVHLRELLARTPTADLFQVASGAHAAVLLPSILIWRARWCAPASRLLECFTGQRRTPTLTESNLIPCVTLIQRVVLISAPLPPLARLARHLYTSQQLGCLRAFTLVLSTVSGLGLYIQPPSCARRLCTQETQLFSAACVTPCASFLPFAARPFHAPTKRSRRVLTGVDVPIRRSQRSDHLLLASIIDCAQRYLSSDAHYSTPHT